MKGQTTENIRTMTRSDLRKTFSQVLDQVAKEDAAVMITGRPTHHLINTKKYRNSALFQMLNRQ